MLIPRVLRLSLPRRLGAARAAELPPPWRPRVFPLQCYHSRGYSNGGSSKYDKPIRQLAEILVKSTATDILHHQAQQPSVPKGCTTNKPAIGGPFKLYDTENNVVTEAKLQGNWILMYFGYTSCPDVGPAEVQKMADVVKLLESKYDIKITPPFITIDPQRDSPAQLKAYFSGTC